MHNHNQTMIVDLRDRSPSSTTQSDDDVQLRAPTRSDIPGIGQLYFDSYESGLSGESVEEATTDIEASWDGDYGEFWEEGSVVAELNGKIVGALLTVKQAPWEQTPSGPFIIELFVGSDLRGRGIARRLMERGLDTMRSQGAMSVGLRVLTGNTRAQNFYRSLGFSDWTPT
ncbi:MAG: N-acetyltransferase family protein [Actinomycetota bacterium]